jgi:hypothetical protein
VDQVRPEVVLAVVGEGTGLAAVGARLGPGELDQHVAEALGHAVRNQLRANTSMLLP